MADEFNPYQDLKALDQVTVKFEGKEYIGIFIGFYRDGLFACVGIKYEFTIDDGVKRFRSRNIRIPTADILGMQNMVRQPA